MRIGIDLGGTKIEGICLGDGGEARARARAATPRTGYEPVLDALVALIAELERDAGATPGTATVGVATPGFLASVDGLVRNSNLAALNGRAVDRDLAAVLGRPVRVANDAKCFILSEATDGAAAPSPGAATAHGPDVVFGATLGTGVGGGLVVGGAVLTGANGSATEWSHTTLPFWRHEDGDGSGCRCGHRACVESFLSGAGLAWDYRQHGGEDVGGPAVAERARAGEHAAAACFARYEDRLARALAGVINLVDPRAIVLGGGISNNARIYDNVPRLWERYTVTRGLVTRLVPAKHGDASGVRGAAWLWPAGA